MVEIPVRGILLCMNRSNSDSEYDHKSKHDHRSQHDHKLVITSWDERPVNMHVHPMAGKTSFDVGHYHQYAGTTEPAPTGIPHVHHYNIETTFNDQHVHLLRGTTGPAIPLPNGGHYHYFEGYTTVNGRIPHTHSYQGRTGNEV